MEVTWEQRPALHLARVKSSLQLTIAEVLVATLKHLTYWLLHPGASRLEVVVGTSELGSWDLSWKTKAKNTYQEGQQLPGPWNVPPSSSRAVADSVVVTPCWPQGPHWINNYFPVLQTGKGSGCLQHPHLISFSGLAFLNASWKMSQVLHALEEQEISQADVSWQQLAGLAARQVTKPLHFLTLRNGIQFVGIIRLFYIHFVPVIYMEHKGIYYLQGLTEKVVLGCLPTTSAHTQHMAAQAVLFIWQQVSPSLHKRNDL